MERVTSPFLIAHKVRGEPAFDIAIQMTCPLCAEQGEFFERPDCHECDGAGYWWIVPTSGHRAYPYWSKAIYPYDGRPNSFYMNGPYETVELDLPEMPPSLPDHYPAGRALPEPASPAAIDLLRSLGLLKPVQPVRRI